MSGFALLALLGVGLLAMVFNGDDDTDVDAQADAPPDDMPIDVEDPPQVDPDPVPGEVLSYTGSASILGTEGNDTLELYDASPQGGNETLSEIRLAEGDDAAIVSITGDPVSVYGEAGNDTINSSGNGNTVYGGDGDDELSGRRDAVYGEAGNDTLSTTADNNSMYAPWQFPVTLDGGAGDDLLAVSGLEVMHQKYSDFYDSHRITVVGGEGADTVTARIDLRGDEAELTPVEELTNNTSEVSPLHLEDFDRAEDSLILRIAEDSDTNGYVLNSAKILPPQDGETMGQLALNFESPDHAYTHTEIITLGENVDIQVSDITFLGGNGVELDVPDPTGEVLTIDGERNLSGTAGDDTLTGTLGDYGNGVLRAARLGDGDDFVDMQVGGTVDYYGEAGDDTILGTYEDTLYGGPGNDVLSSEPTGRIYGDEGNDTLSSSISDGADGNIRMYGGTGDDVLNARSYIGYITSDYQEAALTGGEGADVFNMHLDFSAEHYATPSNGFDVRTFTSSHISVTDFDPAEDVLRLEVTRAEGVEGRELISARVNGSHIDFRFTATDTIAENVSSVWVSGIADIPTEDITLVDSNGVAIELLS